MTTAKEYWILYIRMWSQTTGSRTGEKLFLTHTVSSPERDDARRFATREDAMAKLLRCNEDWSRYGKIVHVRVK